MGSSLETGPARRTRSRPVNMSSAGFRTLPNYSSRSVDCGGVLLILPIASDGIPLLRLAAPRRSSRPSISDRWLHGSIIYVGIDRRLRRNTEAHAPNAIALAELSGGGYRPKLRAFYE